MLAEKRIDLSLYSPEAGSSSKTKTEDLLENEQNVRNRHWEVTYSDYIKKSVFFHYCRQFRSLTTLTISI